MTKIFVPKESVEGETRIAATPETVKRLVKDGHSVVVESGAGLGAAIEDRQFEANGATVTQDVGKAFGEADLVLKLHPPSEKEAGALKAGAIFVGFVWPHENGGIVDQLGRNKIDAFAMDRVPRITRAQRMDALSSQSNLAGYKAVLMAADALPKIFPLMMTAAGTIRPAKVVIMGAGVAGLQAIATAHRLGAVVEATDVRPAVKEQVESLGGKFIDVESDEKMEDSGGYAKEASKEYLEKQRQVVREHIVAADVVITTALVPGKTAPRLIDAQMVKEMPRGAVIVDLAAEQGGNCELTEKGKVVEKEGVTIIGVTNLPGRVPFHASDVYAKNVLAVVQHLFPKGEKSIDMEDEINTAAFVTYDGERRDNQTQNAAA